MKEKMMFYVIVVAIICMLLGIVGKLISVKFIIPVSYTHLRAHETVLDLVCRLLLEKKKK